MVLTLEEEYGEWRRLFWRGPAGVLMSALDGEIGPG